MKYIRTKDKIFRIKATPQSNAMYSGSQTYCIYDHIEMVDRDMRQKDIIAQADTIEELCDEFVIVGTNWQQIIDLESAKYNAGKHDNLKIYGTIWADKGLIYIAKMNDKGELELL